MVTAHWVWPRLFHNRSLDVIAATAKKPKSAWNEDYLLGQWHDMALRSPAAVEAQRRVILRGVDLMIDRATFTLAKSSYRSRCWLNTYWKDNFWPHKFKVVKCLERYVDVWKRFICYVFRVQHFQTHQQQDIYNLRLRRDQTIMMRHVLYLVTLLQREVTNYDSNPDEECDGDDDELTDSDYENDDGDEDDRGRDEKHINEYDRVETEVHSNGNDAHYDMNDGRDKSYINSTFSLQSGLWLHLSEAIFQLSMMFWTYQEPTGDMSASTIIHYTAVLGIQGPSLTFHPAHSSSPKLSALMRIGRLLFLEYAVPISGYNTLGLALSDSLSISARPHFVHSLQISPAGLLLAIWRVDRTESIREIYRETRGDTRQPNLGS
jgi:hypothetical protein